MKVTVILCTYNRCKSLAKALDSIAGQTLPESFEWEVLVVDNNSSDQTREVSEDFCRRYPGRFRHLLEQKQGKSHALNAAIREARGEILAFTDDDVTVDVTWLHSLTAALHDGEWAGSAGRTLPEPAFSPPGWLASLDRCYVAPPLALFDHGPDARELTEPPYGNNMAYKKEVFQKYGGFRTDLGPRPGSQDPQKNEDNEFGCRLLAAEERLRYEGSAVVYHAVPNSKIQKNYFLAWWFDKARADIRTYGVQRPTTWYIGPIPIFLIRKLAVLTLRWIAAVDPCRRFSNKLTMWMAAGRVLECYRLGVDGTGKKKYSPSP